MQATTTTTMKQAERRVLVEAGARTVPRVKILKVTQRVVAAVLRVTETAETAPSGFRLSGSTKPNKNR
jgi:hypothetical protein